jgi:hypothetical protein
VRLALVGPDTMLIKSKKKKLNENELFTRTSVM